MGAHAGRGQLLPDAVRRRIKVREVVHIADLMAEGALAGTPLVTLGGARSYIGVPMLEDDELVESDVILPPRDITFAEAQGEFTGDGLIPD